MAVRVADVMRQVHNFFETEIADGPLTAIPEGAYIAVEGVGVFEPKEAPEVIGGRCWVLYPPADFLALCEEIAAFEARQPAGSPRSESFGAYRYEAAPGGWEAAFASRLLPFRRMFTEVKV